jgi:Mg-chelatase subunit ChlD
MGWGYALDKAKRAVTGLLAQLDAGRAEVGMVTFDDVEALAALPSRDLQDLARSVAALRARGDTQMAGAINLARQHLSDDPGRPGLRRAILVVTDANPSDATVAALQAAADEGIALAAIVVEDGQPADPAFLDALEMAGGRLVFDPAAWELPDLADSLLGLRPEAGLFETIEIVDDIPANMRYIVDSALPPAAFDAGANRLTWKLDAVTAAAGIRLGYRLEPRQVGVWPTNVRASADYRDALGSPGRLVFPVPVVEVVAPGRFLAYLPLLSRGHCPRPERPVDVILVIDSSSSMAEPAEGAEAGGLTKLDAAREAAATFVGLLDLPRDRAAVVSFDSIARREVGLTGEAQQLQAALARLVTAQGTRIDFGLAEAAGILAESRRPAALPVVVVLTDGLQAGDSEPVTAVSQSLKAAGARIYAIGLGAAVDEKLLQAVASSPDRFYSSPSTVELGRIYAEISQRLACERP